MHSPSALLLIIDQDEHVRASLAAHLQQSGYDILQAADAMQGLKVLEQHRPDLVICELGMSPPGDLELIARIIESAPDTPVVAISCAGVISDAVAALRMGAADYLVKPIEDLAMLEHSVRRALEGAALRLENRRYRERLELANLELQASLNLLEEDQHAGRQMQLNMLPQTPWEADGLHFAHRIIPSLYLSGDFVDYFRLDEQRIAFYLADVSGHGASSAFVTVLLKFMTTRLLYESRRNGALPEFKPSEVLGHINRGLLNCKLGKHVTMLGGIIDLQKNQLVYSIGGHLPLPVLYVDGTARYLQGRGLPVGLFEDAQHEDHVLDLPPSFSLSLFSDGVFDLLPGASLKEKEARLPELVSRAAGKLEAISAALQLDSLEDMPDDIAVMTLSRNLA
jgi:serine phosphatase RsbU (regulator of sigma subunit)